MTVQDSEAPHVSTVRRLAWSERMVQSLRMHALTAACLLQGWLQDEKVLEEATQKVALLHQKYR